MGWKIQEFMENQAGSSKQSIPPLPLAGDETRLGFLEINTEFPINPSEIRVGFLEILQIIVKIKMPN